MEKIKLLIVDDVPQTRQDITRLLYFEEDMNVVGEAGNGVEALEKVAELKPDVILMDINMPEMDGITATDHICQQYSDIAVVIISIQGESEYLKKAMLAGARDYLIKPVGSEEMANTIRSVYRLNRQRAVVQQPQGNVTERVMVQESESDVRQASSKPYSPAVEEHTEQEIGSKNINSSSTPTSNKSETSSNEEKPLGLITTIFCGKGGVGKTTLATNIAVVLAQSGKKKVALVDLDLQFGDIAVMLNLTDGNTISELVRTQEELTVELLENFMIRHFTGIDILPAPLFPQDSEYVTVEHVDKILHLLKQNYDYIIVDTATIFDDTNLQVLEFTDQILLVVTREISAIKSAKTTLNILDSLNYRDKLRVVLNRSDQDLGVDIADLEKGLDVAVAHQIPSDERAVISAINKGVPVVISHVSSEISKSIKRMGERMVSGKRLPIQEKQGKHLINRIFSL